MSARRRKRRSVKGAGDKSNLRVFIAFCLAVIAVFFGLFFLLISEISSSWKKSDELAKLAKKNASASINRMAKERVESSGSLSIKIENPSACDLSILAPTANVQEGSSIRSIFLKSGYAERVSNLRKYQQEGETVRFEIELGFPLADIEVGDMLGFEAVAIDGSSVNRMYQIDQITR